MKTVRLRFDVLVEPQDGSYVAHCLQLDLVTTGSTEEAAIQDMQDVIEAHVTFALEHNNMENIFTPAPLEVWQKWAQCFFRAQRAHTERVFEHNEQPRYEGVVCCA